MVTFQLNRKILVCVLPPLCANLPSEVPQNMFHRSHRSNVPLLPVLQGFAFQGYVTGEGPYASEYLILNVWPIGSTACLQIASARFMYLYWLAHAGRLPLHVVSTCHSLTASIVPLQTGPSTSLTLSATTF